MAHGIDLRDHAFTEGRWRATPVWYCVSFGRNLKLAEHLIKLGGSPQYSLYAAAYNQDSNAIRLLVRLGADIEELSGQGETPFLGAIAWSHFEAAAAMLACGANVNAQNDRGMTAAHMMLKKGPITSTSICLPDTVPGLISPTRTASQLRRSCCASVTQDSAPWPPHVSADTGRSQARRSQLTNGRSAAQCFHPASVGVAEGDMAVAQPPLAAETLAGLRHYLLGGPKERSAPRCDIRKCG